MRVLVCGGRTFTDFALLCLILDRVLGFPNRDPLSVTLIHGAAPGADSLADDYARLRGIPVDKYPAEWSTFGRGAGPLRNRKMLIEGKPDLVVAFPGGRGTANMILQAKIRGVRVYEPTTMFAWDKRAAASKS
jgi:hypothetical protein